MITKQLHNDKFSCFPTNGDNVLFSSPQENHYVRAFDSTSISKNHKKHKLKEHIARIVSAPMVGFNDKKTKNMIGILEELPSQAKAEFLMFKRKRTGGKLESLMYRKVAEFLGFPKEKASSRPNFSNDVRNQNQLINNHSSFSPNPPKN